MNDISSNFFSLKDRVDIANLLGISKHYLIYVLFIINVDKKYSHFSIKKKNGGEREIDAPNPDLKKIQSKLNDVLTDVYKPKIFAHGFIRKKSIVTNAINHINKKIVLNFDIKDFFPSITFPRVYGLFRAKPYDFNKEVASTLAQIICYKDKLPQGAPTSPILSNMIAKRLDRELSSFAKNNRFSYSRFADDITMSTKKKAIPIQFGQFNDKKFILSNEILDIVKKNGFEINDSKTRVSKYYQRQAVTGVTVNKKININKTWYRELKAILHNCKNHSVYEEACKYITKYFYKINNIRYIQSKMNSNDEEYIVNWFKNSVLKGKLDFLKMLTKENNTLFIKVAKKYNTLVGSSIYDIEKYYDQKKWLKKIIYVIESYNDNGDVHQGSGTYIGDNYILTCAHNFWLQNPCKKETYNPIDNDKISFDIEWNDNDLDLAIIKLLKTPTATEKIKLQKNANIDALDNIVIAGYPQYALGTDLTYNPGVKIIGSKKFLSSKIYTIDSQIISGMSGGPVLNDAKELIGVIKLGVKNLKEASENTEYQYGFVSIQSLPDKYFNLISKSVTDGR